jgi:hypothetical protein
MTPELTPDAAKGPERIWIEPNTENPHLQHRWWIDGHDERDVEYLRADTTPRWISVKERLPEVGKKIWVRVFVQPPSAPVWTTDEVKTITARELEIMEKNKDKYNVWWLDGVPTVKFSNVPPLPKEESNPPRKEG